MRPFLLQWRLQRLPCFPHIALSYCQWRLQQLFCRPRTVLCSCQWSCQLSWRSYLLSGLRNPSHPSSFPCRISAPSRALFLLLLPRPPGTGPELIFHFFQPPLFQGSPSWSSLLLSLRLRTRVTTPVAIPAFSPATFDSAAAANSFFTFP